MFVRSILYDIDKQLRAKRDTHVICTFVHNPSADSDVAVRERAMTRAVISTSYQLPAGKHPRPRQVHKRALVREQPNGEPPRHKDRGQKVRQRTPAGTPSRGKFRQRGGAGQLKTLRIRGRRRQNTPIPASSETSLLIALTVSIVTTVLLIGVAPRLLTIQYTEAARSAGLSALRLSLCTVARPVPFDCG